MYANRPAERAIVRNNGEFTAHVPSGNYVLTVIVGGATVKTEVVAIRESFGTISIHIPSQKKERPGTGIVSVARINHKVPKQAEKEYKAADKKYKAGDLDASLEHLKRATEIDPEYIEAWNNLGCRYLTKRQPADALAALQRAAAIDKQAPFIHTNMSIAHFALGNIADAEAAARTALTIDATDKKARYILGLSLVAQQEYSDETVKLLRQVEEDFPTARLALAETFARRGNVEQAKSILQNHLGSADENTRPQAEAMLAGLKDN
jgi:tetratricopeptide (TPR) repeat protein